MRGFEIGGRLSASAAASGNDHAAGDVTFSQVARLELDTLLEQLVLRARDVQEAQGRLRGLLHAFLAVARADSLEAVLRHVVDAARELVDARYAALGVVRQGRLTQFVHTGMDAGVVSKVGHLPDGKGLLGLLVDYPQSLRLADIAEHHASVGFPEHHPPMRAFLGVPIQVGTRIFGNLYLTEKRDGAEFTGDDEQLVQALAAAAGAAIENATLLSESRRRHTWQTAMGEISTALLAGTDTDEVLRQLVHHARESLGGVGSGVSVPTDDPEQLRLVVTEGDGYQTWQDRLVPLARSVSGAAITAGHLIVVTDPVNDPRTIGSPDRAAGGIGETVAVPLIGADHVVNGVFTVSRAPGAEPFDQLDLDLVTAVAGHAGLALHLSRVRAEAEQMHLLDDRQQIGDELRHHVIHRLFRHGLALQSAASGRTTRTPAPPCSSRSTRSTQSSATSAPPCSPSARPAAVPATPTLCPDAPDGPVGSPAWCHSPLPRTGMTGQSGRWRRVTMTQLRTQRTAQIVVGLDRTGAHDHAVLTAAFTHAQRAHAKLCIVHAIALDDQPPAAPPDAAARRRQLTTRHDHIQAATADLRRQVAHLGAHDAVHYDIRYGDPATILLDAAQDADLIVIGTRSDSDGTPLLLGTVSQDIAVHATCPVLLIPTTAPTS